MIFTIDKAAQLIQATTVTDDGGRASPWYQVFVRTGTVEMGRYPVAIFILRVNLDALDGVLDTEFR